jgi:hypothetical protein
VRRFKFISPGFFATLGTPLVAGRDLSWTDIYKKIPVAIVSENFAREYWQSAAKRARQANPRRQYGRLARGDRRAADVHDDGVNQPAPTTVYWPVMMDRFEGQKETVRRAIAFAIRSPRAGSQGFHARKSSRRCGRHRSKSAARRCSHLGYFYTKSMARTSFTLVMLAVAGGMALLLGIVGIYGVISYSVSQRTREIGIRMALGAERQSITAMFVRNGLWLTGIGIACGLVAAFATMRLMSSLLFNVSPVDPVTYATITAGRFSNRAVWLAICPRAALPRWNPSTRDRDRCRNSCGSSVVVEKQKSGMRDPAFRRNSTRLGSLSSIPVRPAHVSTIQAKAATDGWSKKSASGNTFGPMLKAWAACVNISAAVKESPPKSKKLSSTAISSTA